MLPTQVTKLGLIADADAHLGWTGDWCVDPSAEGCWLAGTRAGTTLSLAISNALAIEHPLGGDALAHALRAAGELLPSWEYYCSDDFTADDHPRSKREDLALLVFSFPPAASAYRGTCNWEEAEKVGHMNAPRMPPLYTMPPL